jgi:two-component system sensor histidine kinase YesM
VEQSISEAIEKYVSLIDIVFSEEEFSPLFSITDKEELAALYVNLYLLLSGDAVKPGIHIIAEDFTVLMNTAETPREYYSEQYRSWGVLRKAFMAQGEPVLYYHLEKENDNRILTIAEAKLDEKGEILGFLIIDLYDEHIDSFLSFKGGSSQNSILVLDEHDNAALPINGYIEKGALSAMIDNSENTEGLVRKGLDHPAFVYSLNSNDKYFFSVIAYYSLTQINELLSLVAIVIITLAGFLTVMCVILALFVSRNAAEPLQEVVDVLERVGKGDFSVRTNINRNDEFGKLGASVNDMVVKMKQLIDTNRQKEISLRTSEIKSLMNQTKPHFIFNCLETIKWYILLGDTKEASQTIVDLGVLLRSNLDLGEGIVRVEEEVDIIRRYLAIQKRRMGNRVHIDIEVDDSILNVRIPRLLFQPIVENAVTHGLEKKRGTGTMSIKGYNDGDVLHFIVEDDGVGMSQDVGMYLTSYHTIDDIHERGAGLQNLVRRLHLYYGEHAGIHIYTNPGEGTCVSIFISLNVGI